MKRVIVNTGSIGLVFRRGNYAKVLTEGIYWIRSIDILYRYNLAAQFAVPIELSILLKDEVLKEKLHVVEVLDSEIVVRNENGNFSGILGPGRYTYWKGVTEYEFLKIDLSNINVDKKINRNILNRPEFYPYIRIITVEPYQKALLYIDGVFEKVLETGEYYFWKNATKIHVAKADMRQQQIEVSGQEILTKDKAALRVNFYAQYKVEDVYKALNDNKDFEKQLYILLQLALREFIGTLTLDEILDKKDAIAQYVTQTLEKSVVKLGIKIAYSGLRDIILPGEIKEIMNQVLVAEKKAQANTITRREETASTRSLLNTARLMEENEMLFRLKEMEYVEKIAEKINSISLSGGNQVINQLREIFSPAK